MTWRIKRKPWYVMFSLIFWFIQWFKKNSSNRVEPRQALELATDMEPGMQNQHQIQQHNNTLIPASVNAIQFLSNPPSARMYFSNNSQKPNCRPPLYCSIGGGNWLPNHRNKCNAKGKFCNNCGLMNHFAKVCRKQKNTKPQNSKKRTVNTVDEEPHPKGSVKFLRKIKLYESDYSSGEDNTVVLIKNDKANIEPLNMPIKIGNISSTLLVDSRSACSILNRSLATQIIKVVHMLSGFTRRSVHNLEHFPTNRFILKAKYRLPSRATDGHLIR